MRELHIKGCYARICIKYGTCSHYHKKEIGMRNLFVSCSLLVVTTISFGQLPGRQKPLEPGPIEPPVTDKILGAVEKLKEVQNLKFLEISSMLKGKIKEGSDRIAGLHEQLTDALKKITDLQANLTNNIAVKSLPKEVQEPLFKSLEALAKPKDGALPALISVLEDAQNRIKQHTDEASINKRLDPLADRFYAIKNILTHTDSAGKTLIDHIKDLANFLAKALGI
jgi:hypothetical protein